MEAHDLDILVLGRQANVRYVTGAPQLWVAGTRPFAPICVVVRATGEIHLNSTWDEGIPEEIAHDHLYGLAWNPMTLIEVLKKHRRRGTARRVGTDALTPTFAQLLPMAFPQRRTRRRGDRRCGRRGGSRPTDEVAALRGALGVAEDALAAARGRAARRRHRAGAGRRNAGGRGGRRCQHAGHPGRRLGDVGASTRGGGSAGRAGRRR